MSFIYLFAFVQGEKTSAPQVRKYIGLYERISAMGPEVLAAVREAYDAAGAEYNLSYEDISYGAIDNLTIPSKCWVVKV